MHHSAAPSSFVVFDNCFLKSCCLCKYRIMEPGSPKVQALLSGVPTFPQSLEVILAKPHPYPSPAMGGRPQGSVSAVGGKMAGGSRLRRDVPVTSHSHWAFPPPHGLVLEPLLLFPVFLFSHCPSSGSVILGKRLLVPRPLEGPPPKEN